MGKDSFQINGFWDGDRYVVVCAGLDDVKKIFEAGVKALGGTQAADANVHPNETPIDKIVVKEEEKEEEMVFQDGPYKGLSPYTIIATDYISEAMTAMSYITSLRRDDSLSFSPNFKKSLKEAQEYFIYAFCIEKDAFEYAGKLTANQCITFLNRFDILIPEGIKTAIVEQTGSKDWSTFLKESGLDTKQSAVAECISYFQKLKI